MTIPTSVRPDDDAHDVSVDPHDLDTDATATARRASIRSASEAVGAYVATSPEARAFLEEWGTPADIA